MRQMNSSIGLPQGYSSIKLLGEGSFGKVTLAKRQSDGSEVVIKSIQRSPDRLRLIENEVEAGRKLKHPGIVEFVDYIETAETSYIVLEYVEGTDLFELLSARGFAPVPEGTARRMFKSLAKAVRFSHRKGIAHLDLKAENVLVSSKGGLKLIDFGLSNPVTPKKQCQQWVGSPDYASPQILLRQPFSETKADVWSLGVILFIMLVGQIPFDRDERYQALQVGRHPIVRWEELPVVLHPDAKDLLSRMLDIDPNSRISMGDVVNHKWVKPFGV
eukprot:TRINITY_DN945_c0_g1_i1.p1 TRINITY_DN945_c0_g1~~TRINITY_DN945_c0_g1_i1.p1  ORF type:complete len:273 (+),score=91.08 TRINITY_DN945_c0_g1_i1:276-1094(+)